MNTSPNRLQTLPLCARYFCVLLDELKVGTCSGAESELQRVQWALGVLADSGVEVIGAWVTPGDEPGSWRHRFAEMQARGVESMRFVVGPQLALARIDALTVWPRSRFLPSFEALMRECLRQMGPSRRRGLDSALRVVVAAPSFDAALVALDSIAADLPASLVDRWQAALVDAAPFFELSPAQRRLLVRGDAVAKNLHERLLRSLARAESLPSSVNVLRRVEAALAQIGPRLEAHTPVRGRDAVFPASPGVGSLVACP